MRAFVILCCLATAYAASAGYDYEQSGHSIGGFGGSGASSNQVSHAAPAAATEVEKEFFTFTAPEGEFEDSQASNQLANSLKQSLRVIFIKGPESSGLENAALQLAKSGSDERTAIYVLNKQTDFSELGNKLSALNHQSAPKPEVHFVKYRTNADAENAQRTIQQQYDALGGKSSSHNGGVAPVLNFASPAAAAAGHAGGAPAVDPSRAYLPTDRRF